MQTGPPKANSCAFGRVLIRDPVYPWDFVAYRLSPVLRRKGQSGDSG